MNDTRIDRLYELLPAVYRIRDADQGESLKAFLRVIAGQVNLVEDDIQQLYENWFIETCEDWVVPYLGDLIGYDPVHEAGEPVPGITCKGQQRNKVLIPRREVANTIRYRRRKGTLALLEQLSNDVAGWPARAVEFYRLVGITQSLNQLKLDRGKTADLRNGSALELIDSPFDSVAHSADIRRINSRFSRGRYNLPSVGVFVWRLNTYSVTETPAYCLESKAPNCFTFSILGNDSSLYLRPEPESDPMHIAEEINLPVQIRRRFFEEHEARIYGQDKSMQIWVGESREGRITRKPVPLESIVPADLSHWQYQPGSNEVAVDPVLGRIAFPMGKSYKHGVWVSYHYGFSMAVGGGEYDRNINQPQESAIYTVGEEGDFETLKAALDRWREDCTKYAVIEITDSGVYVEPVNIEFQEGQHTLQLRAANRKRPVISLLDCTPSGSDSLVVTGRSGNCFVLDGILVTGRGVQIHGDMAEVQIRHSTLVPRWTLDPELDLKRSTRPSLQIFSADVCVKIDHSITGMIQVAPTIDASLNLNSGQECSDKGQKVNFDPIRICINDSILDAARFDAEVLNAPGCSMAYAHLNIVRSTVLGQIHTHAIELGENTIFMGCISVARRQLGCLRFCYVTPESRTPKRYRCQPELAEQVKEEMLIREAEDNDPDQDDIDAARRQERIRVRPVFNSMFYGMPVYCQLAACCADEIKCGADDESEMGVFHNLFQPQRMANLAVRLDEYLPARMDVGIIESS